jgi:hypothetical protein
MREAAGGRRSGDWSHHRGGFERGAPQGSTGISMRVSRIAFPFPQLFARAIAGACEKLYPSSRSSVFFIAVMPASIAAAIELAISSGRKSAIQTTAVVPSACEKTWNDAL